MAGNKRKTPDINASSQADIAFLLLVFFLVATTMNTDKGLVRVLPPIPPEDVKVEDQKVNERNLLLVFVNASGQLMVGEESMDIRSLKDKAKEFIVNPLDDENLPEKKETEIEMPDGSKWTYNVSEGVVSLQTTRDTSYEIYIQVQNELTRAFNEVRNEVSQSKFGKAFADLSEDEKSVITKAVPLKISEAEPRKGAIKK
ncbi:MAG: biopolymer transporter ExbD [Alistipes sp.]|nr:biopolymer transporter ExbD [Rikenellaceae bacterium]MBQ3148296.1 biopolymer transporter ExbD [Alistipes sp.]MBQ4126527.1 biopolymer transporter ExbD [Alistipes sp.]